MASENHEKSKPAVEPAIAEEMAKYGITRVPVDYFCYGEFRYTNANDAIAYAKRQQHAS
jgi:hypothetical protein